MFSVWTLIAFLFSCSSLQGCWSLHHRLACSPLLGLLQELIRTDSANHNALLQTFINLMLDVNTNSAPQNICNRFTSTQGIHQYNTRSASSGNYYINYSSSIIIKTLFPSLELKFGTAFPKAIEDYQSTYLKRKFKHYYF